jgi:hypothetical protein
MLDMFPEMVWCKRTKVILHKQKILKSKLSQAHMYMWSGSATKIRKKGKQNTDSVASSRWHIPWRGYMLLVPMNGNGIPLTQLHQPWFMQKKQTELFFSFVYYDRRRTQALTWPVYHNIRCQIQQPGSQLPSRSSYCTDFSRVITDLAEPNILSGDLIAKSNCYILFFNIC